MEVVEWSIPHASRNDEFHFWPVGDCHLGAIETDEDSLRAKVKDIVHDPHGYMIGMGDYCECIVHSDPRSDIQNVADWVEKTNIVESQRRRAAEIFSPLAKRGRIIAMLTGNHEEEIHKRHDNDVIRNLCRDLDVTYGGYQAFIVLNFKRDKPDTQREGHPDIREIVWHAWHGSGAAQSEGARLMRLLRLTNEIEAEVYSMGHLHGALTSYTPDRLRWDKNKGRIASVKVTATMSGSWMKSFMQSTPERPLNPHYSEIKGYKPSRIGCPCVTIKPSPREITLTS
jgi:hypothetical protein